MFDLLIVDLLSICVARLELSQQSEGVKQCRSIALCRIREAIDAFQGDK
jgi:hypothetical protein